MEFLEYQVNGIGIAYRQNENGGGMHFGQDYIDIICKRYGKVQTIYEFCSGPGFIGFSLLGANLCDNLILSDIHGPVGESIHRTIHINKIQNVEFFNIAGVRELNCQKIDLVVSNPPHFCEHKDWLLKLENRIYLDKGWNIHREFYKNIGSKLSDNGKILIQENGAGSSIEDF